MKKVISILVLTLCVFVQAVAQQLDPAVRAALDVRLDEYARAMEKETVDVKKGECDFLIDSSSDSLVRQHVALRLYGHYIESPLMGDEAVAIHIYDSWFAPGKVRMHDDVDLMNARIYADFNRSSLIGRKAPQLVLRTRQGDADTLSFDSSGRFGVLFFYDTSCSRCRVESILLRNLFSTADFPVDFYAIYSGDDPVSWDGFVEERLTADYGSTVVSHLWDPELDSDMQRRYALLQTPRLFLVAPDGTIKGRGLDAESLTRMLYQIFEEPVLEYGSDASLDFYDRLLATASGNELTISEIQDVADHIAEASLAKGDTVMFRQMTGDLLYYLAPKTGNTYKEASAHVARKHILNRPDIWKTPDDSMKVVGFALMIDDLLSRSEPGSAIPDLTLPGELLNYAESRKGEWNLRKLRKDRNVIIFHTEGCHVCEAEIAAARGLLSDRKTARRVNVLLVNVDEIISSSSEKASALFDSFDLSTLPFIIETDRKGTVLRRYISLARRLDNGDS